MKQAKFMWKLENQQLPNSITSNFKHNNSHTATRANSSKFLLPSPRLEYAKQHITYAGIKLWNSEVPIHIKQAKSIKTFTKKFRNHLLTL